MLYIDLVSTPCFMRTTPKVTSSYGRARKIFQCDSVLLECKSVASQVHSYLNCKNPFPALRSAYRKHLSTETALVRVTDDIPKTLDSNGEVLFVLLDLSAAFGTLDHQILLKRLRKYFNFTFCFTEIALKWFSSYLLGRSRRVSVADGVPQGSILGPLLFTLYMAPLQDVIHSFSLDSMFYADDT